MMMTVIQAIQGSAAMVSIAWILMGISTGLAAKLFILSMLIPLRLPNSYLLCSTDAIAYHILFQSIYYIFIFYIQYSPLFFYLSL